MKTARTAPPAPPAAPRYTLRLYITGMTPRSVEALANIRELCNQYLAGRYKLEVIDIYENATRARADQIFVSPTLIKLTPAPSRRFVGNLSDRAKLLAGLDLASQNGARPE